MLKENIATRMNEANRLVKTSNFESAEKVLRSILEEAPHNIQALDYLGFVLFFQNRYQEAEKACRDSLQYAPNNAYAMKGLGLCLAAQGEVDKGLFFLQQAINRAPHWFDPRWDALVVCYEHDREEPITKLFFETWRLFPDERRLLSDLATKLGIAIPAIQRAYMGGTGREKR